MIRLQDALVLALLGDGGNEVQPRGDVCRSGGADEHAVVVDPAAGDSRCASSIWNADHSDVAQ